MNALTKTSFSNEHSVPNAITAEVFNEYFLSPAETFTRTLRQNSDEYQYSDRLKSFCINRLKSHDTLAIPEMTVSEVGKYLTIVGSKNTSSCDGISDRIIFISVPYIVQHLTYVYDLCIKPNRFPSNLKTAKVIPHPKPNIYQISVITIQFHRYHSIQSACRSKYTDT